jgi:hypothetical protein
MSQLQEEKSSANGIAMSLCLEDHISRCLVNQRRLGY